jgi:hypothetical protein
MQHLNPYHHLPQEVSNYANHLSYHQYFVLFSILHFSYHLPIISFSLIIASPILSFKGHFSYPIFFFCLYLSVVNLCFNDQVINLKSLKNHLNALLVIVKYLIIFIICYLIIFSYYYLIQCFSSAKYFKFY